MREDNEGSRISASKGRPRHKYARRKKKQLQKVVEKIGQPKARTFFNQKTTETWSLKEKKRLLEGLKRHGLDNLSSVAQFIETKTADEVQKEIDVIKQQRRINTLKEPAREKGPPIEIWLDCVGELVGTESVNLASYIPKMFGFIARNEPFEESNVPRLNWRNIYLFFTNLLQGLNTPDSLTDTEALIVLDLMHAMGDSLRASDVSKQKEILEKKFQLLNTDLHTPNIAHRRLITQCTMKAFSNIFDDDILQVYTPFSESSPSSTATSTATTSELSGQLSSSYQETSTTSELSGQLPDGHPEASSSTSSDAPRNPASSCPPTNCLADTGQLPDGHQEASSSISSDAPKNPASFCPSEQEEPSIPGPSTSRAKSVSEPCPYIKDVNDVDIRKDVYLKCSDKFQKIFIKPKLFTLNPLFIPNDLLDFTSKETKKTQSRNKDS